MKKICLCYSCFGSRLIAGCSSGGNIGSRITLLPLPFLPLLKPTIFLKHRRLSHIIFETGYAGVDRFPCVCTGRASNRERRSRTDLRRY